ncbi:MAG: glutaminyl-peptide cyclotransferase [Pyrinomonadaceae bacterium]
MRSYFVFSLIIFMLSCGNEANTRRSNMTANNSAGNNSSTRQTEVPAFAVDVVKAYPHDPRAFTQGLVFLNGFLYEGTGGKPARGDDFYSSLRKVDIETGKVVQKYDVPPEFFGEGIAILGDKVYQLTWQERTAFVYNLADFKLLREVRYSGEGWGLTHDGTHLIMSDGTHVIRFIDPETFTTVRTITVNNERGQPLMDINELEMIDGELWANVWQSGWIMKIDPATGKLTGKIDLEKIVADERKKNNRADVLNGIAYDPATKRIFVTGKNWTRLFEIKVSPK